MANYLLKQTGQEVQDILDQAPETAQGLQDEVNNREQAIADEVTARNQAIALALQNYYTKNEIDVTLGDYVTSVAMSQAIAVAINNALAPYSTTADMNTAIANAIATALLNYSTTADMNAAITAALTDYYTQDQIDTLLASYATTASVTQAIATALADYYTKSQIDTTLADYATLAYIATALADYYTKTQVDASLANIQAQVTALVQGTTPAKLADNLTSWAERGLTPQDSEWSAPVRTSAGDMSIDSERGAKLLSIVPLNPFFASALKATGFNLLRGAQAAGSGYYFEVPALTYGLINTTEENNGLLFTNAQGENLKPTVYFKPLSQGVPQHANDGTVCAYTDAGGYRFYTCNEPGYIIVSNITLDETCAHIAWSRRYNEYIAIDAAGDAGGTIALASIIHAVHDYDLLLRAVKGEEYAYDEIRFLGTTANWYRRVDRVQPDWTTVDNGDETYTHTATISGMKQNGVAQCGTLALTISGTTISYTDGNATATTDYVLYQLDTQASGTVEISNTYAIEDWGLEILVDATGEAMVTSQYYQSLPDAIAALLNKVPQLRSDLTTEAQNRIAADKLLQQNIEAEETRAKSAEKQNADDIDAEELARQNADTTLQGNIDAEETRAKAAEKQNAEDIDAEELARQNADATLQGNIDAINAKIPSGASSSDKLATESMVNSSIATNTGHYITDNGQPFQSLQDLEAYSGTLNNNDYATVVTTDQAGNTIYNRYKYNASTQTWGFEYAINSTTFTAAQFAAINSGITSALVTKLGDLPDVTALATQISTAISTALVDYYTKTQIDTLIADYSTTAQMTTAISNALASYYTKTDIDTMIADYSTTTQMTSAISSAISTALASYSTTQDMNTAISTALGSYYTKTEIDNLLSGYATTGALSAHTGNGDIHVTAAQKTEWSGKQNAITDGAMIGLGSGICTTAAATAAKEVAISSFILLKNAPVSIRFQYGIMINGATLNISSTGAKPILIDGVALPAGVVKTNTTATMFYDGTNWNVTALTTGIGSSDDLLVDLGLPSGLLWATRNLDVTQDNGFAASPYQYECSFVSWGNTHVHNPISASAFEYNWGTGNDGPYADTPGAALTANFGNGYDAACINLGKPWRMPTTEEFAELFTASNTKYINADGTDIAAETTNKLTTVNGVVGILLKSLVNGKTIFFPCSGYGYGQSWDYRGSGGDYWSSSLHSQTNGRNLLFYAGGVSPQSSYYGRFYGFAVRAVQ